MRIPLAGAGSDHSCAGLKRKSKKKPVFALAKNKKSPNPAHHPSWELSSGRVLLVGSAARVGGRGLEQQLDNEFIILFFLLSWGFFNFLQFRGCATSPWFLSWVLSCQGQAGH